MEKFRIEFDYECYPIWDITDVIVKGVVNLNPIDLNIPNELKEGVVELNNQYQLTYDKYDPLHSGFATKEEANDFVENAKRISLELKKYLNIEEVRILNPDDLIISS